MSERLFIAKTDDLAPGESTVVIHENQPIAVFNVEGRYFACSNLCPHAAGPLEHGFIEDGRIICPWHGWSFPLSPEDPPNDGLPRYRVVLDNGGIYVELTPVEVDKRWK